MNYTKSDNIRWNNMYELLISYKKKHGDCLVPTSYKEQDRKLGHWVRNQRYNYKNNELSNDRINKLKLVGFVFYRDKEHWDYMYERLVSYKEKYGNCLIPNPYKEDTKLANWVTYQKWCYKNDKLTNNQIDKLKSIGFVFHHDKEHWDDMYERLVSYKEKYGNCSVPRHCKEDKQLGSWVSNQRQRYKNNKLSNDQIDKLKSIGFVVVALKKQVTTSTRRVLWNDMYNRLVSYKQKYGNCSVPTNSKEDTKLGSWVHHQRTAFKHNKLSNDRIDKLKSIGFAFRMRVLWDGMFNRLVSYKEKYGNCSVPRHYKEDTKLANWVREQRQSFKNNKMSNERMEKLKSIDFVFELRNMSHRNNENNNIKSSLGQEHEIVKTVTETRTGTTTLIRNYARCNADVKEGEEETMTSKKYFFEDVSGTLPTSHAVAYGNSVNNDENNISRLSATSSVLNGNVSSHGNLLAASNVKNSGCDDNDSIFADAEEDIYGSWGYL